MFILVLKVLPNINLNEAVRFIADAWHGVTPATIRHCWTKAGIVPEQYIQELHHLDHIDDTASIIELVTKQIADLKADEKSEMNQACSASEYIEADDNEACFHCILFAQCACTQ